jgi:Flp pilus assembly protein TadG
MRAAIGRALIDDRGVTAVEFGLIAPAFIALLFGVINLGVLMDAQASLHYAAEESARCASVKTTVCGDATSTQTYAASHYYGPDVSATFIAASAPCGNSVSASGTYVFNAGFFQLSIPLSAAACFP